MNWVDVAVLGVVAVSGLIGLLRGAVREVLGVGAWLLAGLIASPFGVFPSVQPIARSYIKEQVIADAVAFGLVFIVVLGLLLLVVGWVSRRVHGSVLGGLDRTLGLLFGLARGGVLLAVAYIIAGLATKIDDWPTPVLEARSLPLIYLAATQLAQYVPVPYRPAVLPPPPGRATRAADLMRVAPAGRATESKPIDSRTPDGKVLGTRAARE